MTPSEFQDQQRNVLERQRELEKLIERHKEEKRSTPIAKAPQ